MEKRDWTSSREDVTRAGTTTDMTLVGFHQQYHQMSKHQPILQGHQVLESDIRICLFTGIYDDDLEIITLDSGDFGKIIKL